MTNHVELYEELHNKLDLKKSLIKDTCYTLVRRLTHTMANCRCTIQTLHEITQADFTHSRAHVHANTHTNRNYD